MCNTMTDRYDGMNHTTCEGDHNEHQKLAPLEKRNILVLSSISTHLLKYLL